MILAGTRKHTSYRVYFHTATTAPSLASQTIVKYAVFNVVWFNLTEEVKKSQITYALVLIYHISKLFVSILINFIVWLLHFVSGPLFPN